MPQRKVIFANDQYYHIFNRSINKEPIFIKQRDCQRALETLGYYRFDNPPIRLSYFLAFGPDKRLEIARALSNNTKKIVDITSFTFMPNHFHFLLKQNVNKGISKFLALFQNSYTRYFNTKNTRSGHVFQGQFKAVRVEDDEQLLHLNRYIHLNPHTSYVVKTFSELKQYPYSSLPEYLNNQKNSLCNIQEVLSHFSSIKKYEDFLFDQAGYQRALEKIKHLILE